MNRWKIGWLAIPFVLIVWTAISSQYPSYIFPSPVDVWHEGVNQVNRGELQTHILLSLQRLVLGFLISAFLAFIVGIVAGASRTFRDFLMPLVTYFQATPPMAWAPLLIILLGLGDAPMIAVIIIASFFPILINVMQGMNHIPESHIRAAKSLGAKGWRLAYYVYLPEIFPAAISGIYIGFAISWRSLVAAEMIGGNAGIGYFIAFNGQIGNAASVLLGILLIGFLALFMDYLLLKPLHKRFAGWASRTGN
ncbi:ABC transporter permease [Halalkalibacter nanhaiisediminis]|uniref:NitT/TauT family transport system permease protein/taurine transport system permease protein n=1 Tax=Halalkalibacter nanhaiisediminis TaxID=688079 RepID=A0A562QMH4_9BACI|nr:ABC transporter permease [Halalkalibacter nanhaiisediminis]TWI57939.1 NitT/TauT family transport system permease protein/taurine transport system permease protein [Halalkalibacter nanhaiisediminis]